MVELYLHSPICLYGIVRNYIIKYRDNFTFTVYWRRCGYRSEENGGVPSLLLVHRSPVCFVPIGEGEGLQEDECRECEVTCLHVGLPLCQAHAPTACLKRNHCYLTEHRFSLVGYAVLTAAILKSILSSGT
jgi:hypothetical protein